MWDMLFKMSGLTLLMCALSAVLWILQSRAPLKSARPWVRRLIESLVFGGAAILSTHFGVTFDNMVLNVRDIAPLSAGLFFDPFSGVIAGLIGGAERYVAGRFFGVGAFSCVACSISTALSGVFAALCRKYLFEGKRPSPFYAFALGALMEVFHMLMVLLTHMDDMSAAFDVVRVCAVPMILFAAVGLMLSSVVLSALSGSRLPALGRTEPSETPITRRFQSYLLIFVSLMMACTFAFTFTAETRLTVQNAEQLILLNAGEIDKKLIEREENLVRANELIKKQALSAAHAVAGNVRSAGGVNAATEMWLRMLAERYDIYEINVVGADGIIISSTNSDYVGFNMSKGGQSVEFMALSSGAKSELVQDFQPISYDSSVSIMYAGVALSGGFVQVGFNDAVIEEYVSLADISAVVSDRRIGDAGYAFLADADGRVVSQYAGMHFATLTELGVPENQADGFFFADVLGERSYCYLTKLSGYRALMIMHADKMYRSRDIFAYETALMEILVFAAIFGLIYVLVRRIIIVNLDRVNESLARITSGNLDEVVSVRDSAEFASLSEDINTTVAALKRYIAEAENRINAELEFAKAIQLSALPSVFPPFPDKKEFELYALMDTAKEVGGDFYDFFLVDERHLALVMADVSGKGIPAALFMMKSKTLIKSLAESGLPPEEVISTANRKLCEGNDAEMFVTVWLGILDLATGEAVCVNAGHEYPILRRANGAYELFKDRHGFVLGGMESAKYRPYTLTLSPGDRLFVYTDGVTEATDAQNTLFGTDRLLAALSGVPDASPEATVAAVKRAIDAFVAAAPQFDDITMLSIVMSPVESTASRTFVPEGDAAARTVSFCEEYFAALDVPQSILMKLCIAVDEIATNIVSYSGAKSLDVSCTLSQSVARIRFCDDGAPFNPLAAPDPDVTLPAEERGVGGLGIYMVKKTMDAVHYEYTDGKNTLTIEKNRMQRS